MQRLRPFTISATNSVASCSKPQGKLADADTFRRTKSASIVGFHLMTAEKEPLASQSPSTPTPVGSFNITQLGYKSDKIGKDTTRNVARRRVMPEVPGDRSAAFDW